MKKIIALVMALCLCVAALTVFAVADEPTNPEIEIEYTAIPPTLDGIVEIGEYGLKIHSVDYNDPNFGSAYDTDKSIKADFYATWDKDSLYLAWVVESNLDEHFAPDLDANMWEHCCIQFIMTTGKPDNTKTTYQTSTWSGDYLEVGLCIPNDGDNFKVCWSTPSTASSALGVDDWDFAGTALVDGKTTYECRIPWTKSGVLAVGNDVQIGLAYAIGDQEDFTNIENNMVEWPDAMLGGKNADAAAVVTLTGDPDGTIDDVSQDSNKKDDIVYVVPVGAVTASPTINSAISAGSTTVVTNFGDAWYTTYNTVWSGNVLLAPTDDPEVYTVVESVQGQGAEITFASEIGEGYIVLALHGDNTDGDDTASCVLRNKYLALEAGTEITFKGYDLVNGELTAGNPMVWYVEEQEETPSDDPSQEPSQDESSSEPVSDEPSDEPVSDASKAEESSKTEDNASEDNGGFPWWIVIVAVAVIAIGVVVFIIIKKKK